MQQSKLSKFKLHYQDMEHGTPANEQRLKRHKCKEDVGVPR